jgi:hypothetical protein
MMALSLALASTDRQQWADTKFTIQLRANSAFV